MQTWYKAICHQCGEAQDIFINVCTVSKIMDIDDPHHDHGSEFLDKHHKCELVLAWRDEQIDKLKEQGFKYADGKCSGLMSTRR